MDRRNASSAYLRERQVTHDLDVAGGGRCGHHAKSSAVTQGDLIIREKRTEKRGGGERAVVEDFETINSRVVDRGRVD